MDKLKGILVKSIILLINAGLVVSGVFFIKNNQDQKQVSEDLANNANANNEQKQLSEQALQLQKIVEQNRNQKTETISKNPSTITVQKPTTVTQTIPAKTTTVKVPVASSSSSSSSSSKTTKKS
jgi:biopolymer transport protein ExbB/TolQ